MSAELEPQRPATTVEGRLTLWLAQRAREAESLHDSLREAEKQHRMSLETGADHSAAVDLWVRRAQRLALGLAHELPRMPR